MNAYESYWFFTHDLPPKYRDRGKSIQANPLNLTGVEMVRLAGFEPAT